MNSSTEAEQPVIQAATVLLVRDSDGGPEVFMLVRGDKASDRFAGALVFPGGKVDGQDSGARLSANYSDSWDESQRALRVAALREAFEESGVLLARDGAGALINSERMAELGNDRQAVASGELLFADLLQRENLTLAIDALVPFAHWLTPPMAVKRFDTHFFVVRLPANAALLHCGRETVDCVWRQPVQLVLEANQGKWNIVFPTLCTLSKLALFNSVDGLLSNVADVPPTTVSPQVSHSAEGMLLQIPADAGYPVYQQLLPAAKK